jgi:hypothetical protein
MKNSLSIIAIFTIIITVFPSAPAGSDVVFSGGEDTLSLYKELSSELLKNPSDANSYRIILKLTGLSIDAGRDKTAQLFRKCAQQIKEINGEMSPGYFVLITFAEYLEYDYGNGDSNYKGIDKWLVSGPWQKFGRPDLYYPFLPETGRVFSEFKSTRSEQERRIYPFGLIPERRGVVYAAASFSVDIPVRIWVLSNSSFRLFVNGVEVMSSGIAGRESLSGVSVKGSRGYTLLLKIADNRSGDDPFFSIIITDSNNREINPDITWVNNRGDFTHEEIFSASGVKLLPGFPGAEKMEKIRRSMDSRDLTELYNEAKIIYNEYPLCGESYHTFIPLLIQLRRVEEFMEAIARYREKFPASEYYLKWMSDFYRTGDEKKFSAAMEKINSRYCDYDNARAYIKLLADKNEKRAAARYSEKFKDIPSFRIAAAEVEKSLSTPVQWRKYLLERISETGDPLYYFYMGQSEMDAGLDPVLYWEKGLSIKADMREMRDEADIFENGGGKGSVFYSGRYTDFHPEFLWNGIKRKVTVRVFANGKYMVECEELIPSTLAGKRELYLIKLKNTRVLYALRCSGGEAFPQEYEISGKDEPVSVKFKDAGKADFFVLKYTGYSAYDQYPLYVMNGIEIKRDGEDISEVMVEVISEGITPAVVFMDKKVSGEKSAKEGETIFRISEKFNYKNSERGVLSAAYKADYKDFASWYSSMLNTLKKKGGIEVIPGMESGDIQNRIAVMQNYIKKNYITGDRIDFDPRFPSDVVLLQKGTTEDLAVLSCVIAEKAGIKSFISFIKEKGDTLSENCEAALFIPESKGRGSWIRFTDRNNFKNPEALLIKGDNFEIIPVSDK